MAASAQPVGSTAVAPPMFPRYVAFKGANQKFLGWNKGGFLKFCYDDLSSPFVKQELVEVEKEDGASFVNIKCCFNHKFWRKQEENSSVIVAGGESAHNNRKSWSCTLFEAKYDGATVEDKSRISLQLVQHNKMLPIFPRDMDNGLHAEGEESGRASVFYDMLALDILPDYVAFKGDNGLYLAASPEGAQNFLHFNNTALGSSEVRHYVEAADGYVGAVRIRNLHYNRYWRNIGGANDYILSDAENVVDPLNTTILFRPLRLHAQMVALRSLANDNFCKRFLLGHNRFSANATRVESFALLKVEETVVERRVHSIVYDLDNAGIYERVEIIGANAIVTNPSNESSTTLLVPMDYTDKKSRSWSNSVSFSTDVPTTITAGIPEVDGVSVVVSKPESTITTQWGETHQVEKLTGFIRAITLAPAQTAVVNVVLTQVKYNVSFSYTQDDLLSDGKWVTKTANDGLYTGMNYTNPRFK